MRIRLALDQSVGRRRVADLVSMGYDVVVVARHSETDESWVNRAFAAGASFAVSPDMDIPKLIEQNKYPIVWIHYPCDDVEHKGDLVGYIDQRIKFKLDLFKTLVAEPKKEEKKWYSHFLSFTK